VKTKTMLRGYMGKKTAIAYLKRLAKHVNLSYEVLLKNLQNRCGDKWTVNFPSTGESFTFDVPELLDPKPLMLLSRK